MHGWVLWLSQREQGEEWFEETIRVEISDIEFSHGKTKASIYQYFDGQEKLQHDSFGKKVLIEPEKLIGYLENVLATGSCIPIVTSRST